MLTGTPLDLTPFGGVVAAFGWLYWIVAASIVVLVWRASRSRGRKMVFGAVAALLVAAPLIASTVGRIEAKKRLERATAQFEMRCKSAGEFIKRTVDNVDGIVWMKWRQPITAEDEFDQFKLTDPFGRDCDAQGCIEQLLRLETDTGRFAQEIARRKGRYAFVESIDPTDGLMYRYRGVMNPRPMWTEVEIANHRRETGRDIEDSNYWFQAKRQRIERFTVRYGVTWDDISTPQDREHWIAGGRLQVIDLQTNEVIAERIGYMMDRGLGDRSGFRTPWLYALRNACPSFPSNGTHSTRRWPQTDTVIFITKVLSPREGN